GLGQKDIKLGAFTDDNRYIEVINDFEEILVVPVKQVDFYKSRSKSALQNITKVIQEERSLSYTITDTELTIEVNNNEKGYFYSDEDSEEILFPELVHGSRVEIEGRITRLNDRTGTLGLEYQQ